MTGLERCTCSPDCTLMKCVTCWTSDCKWPGGCKGKCRECGGPARPSALLPEQFDCYCSDACGDANWARAEAAGLVVAVSELTPEQFNEALKRGGLMLGGIGERVPS